MRRADPPAVVRGDGDRLDRWEEAVPVGRTGALDYTVWVLPKESVLGTKSEPGVVTVVS